MTTLHLEESIQPRYGTMPTITLVEYVGRIFATEGGSEIDVNNRVKAAWTNRKKYPEACTNKPDTQQLHTIDMIMLRWERGKTKKVHIKNEDT